jgi:hypothetical protein
MNTTSSGACLGTENPNRLVNLWDIVNTFHAADFGAHVERLTDITRRARVFVDLGRGGEIDSDLVSLLQRYAAEVEAFCQKVRFEDSELAANFLKEGTGKPSPMNVSHVQIEAKHLSDALLKDAFHRNFIVVENSRAGYVDNDTLFGSAVAAAFPKATADIRESGNCFAVRCCTAAVFHLMRVAEHGLRALAWDRRVKLARKAVLDLATWETIIKELETEELKIQGYPKTLARESQLQFYHGAMMEFRAFKNKFRNSVMHSRDIYDDHEAQSAFVHVRDFMRTLASHVSETVRTPVVWKGRKWTTINP